jgi:hypothetical protein
MRRFHSRVDHRVWRAFMALDGEASTGHLIRWVWPRKSRFDTKEYRRVRAAAAELADAVGYQHRGRCSSEPGGWRWRLKSDVR